MKSIITIICVLLFAFQAAEARESFDSQKDILIAQFDGRPDADDIHSQAALGCMLLHPDLEGVNVYAVMNAYGRQPPQSLIWDSSSLMDLVFDASPNGEYWTNADKPKAEGGNGTGDWYLSVARVRERVIPILLSGGHIWVQEAGQSNFSADWIAALIAEGVSEKLIKDKVTIVQHGEWNENNTNPADLEFVTRKADYVKIDSGNYGAVNDPHNPDNDTADYKTHGPDMAVHAALRNQAKSDANPNEKARVFWTEADRIIGDWSAGCSPIDEGGLDFSDCVENWWIFDIGTKADTIETFWSRYVINGTCQTDS